MRLSILNASLMAVTTHGFRLARCEAASVSVKGVSGHGIVWRPHLSMLSSSAPQYPKPDDIKIPMDRVDFKYARSSGPGGQNVNKVNSKAEIRFCVKSADWLPEEVRTRLLDYQSNRINNDGELIVTSQEHRQQSKNKEACLGKMREMIADAYIKPKDRKMWTGIGDKGKQIRRIEKSKRSETKKNRSKNFKDW
jgi:protein subunit release factor B